MAAPFLTVTIDTRQLGEMLQSLARPGLDDAVAKGLAATTKNAQVKAASLIAKRTGLKSAVVRPRIIPDYVRAGDYTTHIRSSRRPIALADFPSTKPVATGVATRAWGKPQIIAGAFFATMPAHSSADAGIGTGGDGHRGAFRRSGRSRLPIRKLWGPTIAGTFATPEVAKLIAATLRQRLDFNLRRAMRSALRRRR